MSLLHDLVLYVAIEVAIRDFVLDSDDTKVIKNYVFHVHRHLDFSPLSLGIGLNECKVVSVRNCGVPAVLLLIFNQLLSNKLILM